MMSLMSIGSPDTIRLRTVDLLQVNRILDAIGPEHFPEGLDRAELSRGLDLCAQWYREALRYSTRKSELQHQGRLAAISKTAKRLRLLLDEEGKAQEQNGSGTLHFKKMHETQELLRTLIEATEGQLLQREKQDGPQAAYQRSFRKWSPFEWLVGRWLPLVYMEIGMKDPGSLESLVARDSPYVRFVLAALTELGARNGATHYSRSSVIKAIRLPFTGKVRRKGAGQADGYYYWRVQLLRRVMKPHLNPDAEQSGSGKISYE
ncbi:MAG: hypothetical protein EOQ46_26575 [Mesorhizobium sp.]|uniref:hypothetical protein n=1 Tax=Mesorhizobium sp. TaxID=1871066 RepID=UPI000FE605A2|nr:hypothetical protein [Mesorhizobium sp.]RWB39799.1 MAG: hypothetical protein EOQ46_26575 [Mesorhizobium sp.]